MATILDLMRASGIRPRHGATRSRPGFRVVHYVAPPRRFPEVRTERPITEYSGVRQAAASVRRIARDIKRLRNAYAGGYLYV